MDSNYQNALAWYRALRRYGRTVPVWQIHRAIGMGGDQLVSAVYDSLAALQADLDRVAALSGSHT